MPAPAGMASFRKPRRADGALTTSAPPAPRPDHYENCPPIRDNVEAKLCQRFGCIELMLRDMLYQAAVDGGQAPQPTLGRLSSLH